MVLFMIRNILIAYWNIVMLTKIRSSACSPPRIIGHHMGFAHTDFAQRAIAHGVFRGSIASIRGGNFRNGFLSAFVSTMSGMVQVGKGWTQGAFQALVGGTTSVISGGKFMNGAVSAASTWIFNDYWNYECNSI